MSCHITNINVNKFLNINDYDKDIISYSYQNHYLVYFLTDLQNIHVERIGG